MNGTGWNRWLFLALTLAGIAVAAGVAYNVGLSQGLAQVGSTAGSPSYSYGWHRPWGFGFLFPLLFVFFWVMVIRGFWWRPWGHWSYYGPPPHARDRFEEWHRQAHERMKGTSDS